MTATGVSHKCLIMSGSNTTKEGKFSHVSEKCSLALASKLLIRIYVTSNAGFFVYVDLSPWVVAIPSDVEVGNSREYALAQRLLDGGVGLHPCEEHDELIGHFRLVFSQDKEVLEEGLRRWVLFSLHFQPIHG